MPDLGEQDEGAKAMSLDLDDADAPEPDTRIMVRVAYPVTPSEHLVLVETPWVNELGRVEERVRALKVVDAPSAQTAADLQRRLTTAGNQLDAARKERKAPFLAICTAIEDAARGPMARIEQAKRLLKDGLTSFAIAEAERVRREQEARQAEIRRLEVEAAAERERIRKQAEAAAEAARKAREAAEAEEARILAENEAKRAAGQAAPMTLGLEDDDELEPIPPALAGIVAKDGLLWRNGKVLEVGEADRIAVAAGLVYAERAVHLLEEHQQLALPPAPPAKTEAEVRLEQAIHAPAPVAAAPAGVAMRVTLELDVVDVDKMPAPFITKTANLVALRKTYLNGWKDGDDIPECPGVTFKIKREPISTRQRI